PRPSAVQPRASRPVAEPPVAGPEVEALKLAVHRPEEMAGRLHEVLFADELHLAAYRALATSTTLHEAIESADPGAAALLQRLAVEEPDADPDDVLALIAQHAVTRVLAEARSAAAGAEGPLSY